MLIPLSTIFITLNSAVVGMCSTSLQITSLEGRSQSFKGDKAQLGLLTALIECSIRVLRFFQIFIGRAQPTFGWAWPTLGYAPASLQVEVTMK